MNILLVDPDELGADGVVTLTGRRARHIRSVLGGERGDELRVGVVRGPRGSGEIREIGADAVTIAVTLEQEPAVPPAIDLILAVPRPKELSRIVRAASAFGIGRIDLVNAWRVDKSYFASPRLGASALAREARLGCEQGAHTWLPEVAVHPRFLSSLTSLGACGDDPRRRIVGHPRAAAMLEEIAPPGTSGPMVVAIGPEGGWIDRELASLRDAGFAAARVGNRVLRTNDAVIAILAQLEVLRRL